MAVQVALWHDWAEARETGQRRGRLGRLADMAQTEEGLVSW